MSSKRLILFLLVNLIILDQGQCSDIDESDYYQEESDFDNTIKEDLANIIDDKEMPQVMDIAQMIESTNMTQSTKTNMIGDPNNNTISTNITEHKTPGFYDRSQGIIAQINYYLHKYHEIKNRTHNDQVRFKKLIQRAYKWVQDNRPLIDLVIKLGRILTEDELAHLPLTRIFLDILEGAITWEVDLVKEKFLNTYSNYTIAQLIEAIKEHCNWTEDQSNLHREFMDRLMTVPWINEMVESAMVSDINGMPFAFAMMDLLEHIENETTVGQLNNGTVLAEIYKNITYEVSPFMEQEMNRTMVELRDHLQVVIRNLTDVEVAKGMGEFAKNASVQSFEYLLSVLINRLKQKFENY